ncbi:hypothetical protein DLAC_10405 [Tieghemostelium lacteum]|uniref:Methyltransferase type 11 domain-containing protein n=1 Tax=Tieghemostelium lacteum TaxID=361077 RepID=A0A151Z5B6_TIELA|nr:hypothetical protein DLAC_10405 [Tieghemostelium lacteum]|eukprot:KYQ89160.1 hypothetical protein DLAC_10405 [Tieghemostelium lacteum]
MSIEDKYGGGAMYWDNRYINNPESFDWYQSYEGLKTIINEQTTHTDNILMVGCGNSLLSEDMANDGYKTILNCDISSVVIEQCKERFSSNKALTYEVQNILQTDYKDSQFDAVIDKGTFDTIMCGDNSQMNAIKMCREIYRILKPGGVYIMISYGRPKDRTYYIEFCNWEIILEPGEIPKSSNTHYIYICRLGQMKMIYPALLESQFKDDDLDSDDSEEDTSD